MSNPNTRAHPRFAWLAAGLIALALYAALLMHHASPVAGNADSSGYLNSARLLTEGRLTSDLRTVPELDPHPWNCFVPLGFVGEWYTTRLMPTYPVGLPIHLVVAQALFGWHWGAILVCAGAGVALVLLCFLTACALGLSRGMAAACAVSLAACPLVIWGSTQTYSDVLASTWTLASVLAALRSRTPGGRALAWSIACGASCALAVMVRPSAILVIPALVILLGDWRRLSGAALGGLPGAVLLAWYQHSLYGSALRTGYGNAGYLFSTSSIGPALEHFAIWIPRLLPVAWIAVVCAVFLPWRRMKRELAALGALILVTTGFYSFYVVSAEDWSCLRFLLPAFPAITLVAGLGVEGAVRRRWIRAIPAGLGFAAVALMLVAVAGFVSRGRALRVLELQKHNQPYVEAAAFANARISQDALVMAMQESGSLYFYTNFPVLRYDQMQPEHWATYSRALLESDRPLYAVLWAYEVAPALEHHAPGRWERVGEFEDGSVWRFVGLER